MSFSKLLSLTVTGHQEQLEYSAKHLILLHKNKQYDGG